MKVIRRVELAQRHVFCGGLWVQRPIVHEAATVTVRADFFTVREIVYGDGSTRMVGQNGVLS